MVSWWVGGELVGWLVGGELVGGEEWHLIGDRPAATGCTTGSIKKKLLKNNLTERAESRMYNWNNKWNLLRTTVGEA